MTRAVVLRDLMANGTGFGPERLRATAVELGLPLADVLVVAGQPVPAELLPPERDPEILRAFTYRVTYCDHRQLAVLEEFVRSLAAESPAAGVARDAAPGPDRFADIFNGLLRNRGLGRRELPFAGLSMSTIVGLQQGRWHNLKQLAAMAGPLGWQLADLAVLAGEPDPADNGRFLLCHHYGRVYLAAVPLTSDQLVQALWEADRLSGRVDHGAWQPVVTTRVDCPDEAGAVPGSG